MKPGWTEVALGEICTFLSGGTPSRQRSDYFDGPIPWITGADITGQVAGQHRATITEAGLKSCPANLVSAGTVLLVTRTSVGKVAVCDRPLSFSQDITAVLHDEKRIDRGYLVHTLAAKAPELKRHARGATILGVTRSDVEELRVALPPLEEQKRIAAILDKADDLQARRRAAITHLDSLTRAIFSQMFGRSRALALVSAQLGELAALVTKGTTPTSVGFSFAESGIPFLRVQDLVDGTVDVSAVPLFIGSDADHALRRSRIKPGDVLISIAGTIGRCAIVPTDAPAMNCNQAVAIVRGLEGVTPRFLLSWLHTQDAQAQMSGSQVKGTISNLSLTRIKELVVPVPSLEEQSEFAQRVVACESTASWVRSSGDSLEALASSLRALAFGGEL